MMQNKMFISKKFQIFRMITTLVLSQSVIGLAATNTSDQHVDALTEQYLAAQKVLNNTQYKRPLLIESIESDTRLKSEVFAVINHPFTVVQDALINPRNWCDALILHINIKYCRMDTTSTKDAVLNINIGQKFEQPLTQTYQSALNFKVVENTKVYFLINLTAKNGPLKTYDYHILIEAMPLKNSQTFLHFKYAYSFGALGKIAMKTYLNTVARNKVGFSITATKPNGEIVYIRGVRGVIERNTMRYFLAIDAYLAAMNDEPRQQLLNRLNDWYDSTELYKTQLHEVEHGAYIQMKQNEVLRQNTAQ